MKARKLPLLAYNRTTIFGVVIALGTICVMTFLHLVGALAKTTNPYVGLILYMVMPPILLFGMFLIPVGMFFKWRRSRRIDEESYPVWPYIDLNLRNHRNGFFVFFFGTILFVGITAVGSYESYHFTDSVTFCGRLCHKVMKPEYTAYQNSPHARVPCVACHVGPGADWFAKSKLSGMYQVYATLANKFPRPIPTPIKNLRPARETCEQCHWPEKFFGAQQRLFTHHLYDESNTYWPISMLMIVDGGRPREGQITGIHWHVNSDIKVEYIARDKQRQDIPWVRSTDLTSGEEIVYKFEDDPIPEEEVTADRMREMDCVDCHNRPSHIYYSPDKAVDHALWTHRVSQSLPDFKRVAVEALDADYNTEAQALDEISRSIRTFYENDYPDVSQNNKELIDSAESTAMGIYAQYLFPEMGVRWSVYPDNIGHFISAGCMRCHDGLHVDENGVAIKNSCNACHVILSQGITTDSAAFMTEEGQVFQHPEDIDEAWLEMGCYECHEGVQP